jgi:anti-sigma regulatory factor (Ser/Thr protein kinase)
VLTREFVVATRRLTPGLDALEAALRAEHVVEEAVLDLRLVAEEVFTNVAKYGHDDGAEHRVRLHLSLVAEEVVLTFTDDGRPFDPTAAATPDLATPPAERAAGGLGIHLVLSLVDSASYARVGTENVLTLRKVLSARRTT